MPQLNIWMLLAVLAGVCATFQSSANGSLARTIGASAAVTLNTVIFLIASLIFLFFDLSKGQVSLHRWQELSWSQYLGGIFGFGVVLFLTLSFPRLGALSTIVLMILGQSITALIVDHHGLWNMPQTAISLQRMLAILVILSGVILLNKSF